MKSILKDNNCVSCFVLFSILLLLMSCISNKRIDPDTVNYIEITADEYVKTDKSSLFSNKQGCKVTTVFLSGYVWEESLFNNFVWNPETIKKLVLQIVGTI